MDVLFEYLFIKVHSGNDTFVEHNIVIIVVSSSSGPDDGWDVSFFVYMFSMF